MIKRMRSDEIGEIGESHFKLITAQGGLVCNKSIQDKAGWDYVVDWPISEDPSIFDRRQNPPSIVVQVKAALTTTKTIRMRLSSAERLLKDPKPSFIYMLKVDSSGVPRSARLVHMYGEMAELVLTRLRETQLAGGQANKVQLVFNLSSFGVDIPLTAKGLTDEVERVVGADVAAYVAMKAAYLTSVGFEDGQFHFTATFAGVGPRDIADAFLGLKTIPMAISNFSEVRFGLAMPALGLPGGGTGAITPQTIGQCELLFRRTQLELPLIILGDVYALPEVVSQIAGHTILVRSPALTLRMDEESLEGEYLKMSAAISINLTDSADVQQSISGWSSLFRLLWQMTQSELTVQIKSTVFKRPMNGAIGILNNFPLAKEVSSSVEAADRIFKIAGASSDVISLRELQLAHEALTNLRIAELSPEAITVSFGIEWHVEVPHEMTTDILYFYAIPFRNFVLAYCCEARVSLQPSVTDPRLSGKAVKLWAVRRLNWDEKELEQFKAEMAEQTGIESVIYSGLTHAL